MMWNISELLADIEEQKEKIEKNTVVSILDDEGIEQSAC
jgi:hypothetical protein